MTFLFEYLAQAAEKPTLAGIGSKHSSSSSSSSGSPCLRSGVPARTPCTR
jgi:hypothetical protein